MISHMTSADMAYQLVGYIDCDRRIKKIIAGEFRQPISVGAIAKIRENRQRREAAIASSTEWRRDEPDPYFSKEYDRRLAAMEASNDRFVRRLVDAGARLSQAQRP